MLNSQMPLLLLELLCIQVALSEEVQYASTIIVSPHCVDSDPNCHSLDNDYAYSNSTKIVIRGEITLYKPVVFSKLDSIAFFGENNAKVICSGDGSGIAFLSMTNVLLTGLHFFNCSMSINGGDVVFKSGVHIENSTNVTIIGSIFSHTNGIGVTLWNLIGIVNISGSDFTNNRYLGLNKFEGGGLHIKLSDLAADFFIKDCTFESNDASRCGFSYGSIVCENRPWFGQGGGLFVRVTRSVSGGLIRVSNCKFNYNSAQWGGGMAIRIEDSSSSNAIHVENCTFYNNSCAENGGGGSGGGGGGVVVVQNCNGPSFSWNYIKFVNSSFTMNTAAVGGGVLVISKTSCELATGNKLEFNNCTWSRNSARTSAAVDLTNRNISGSVQPLFKRCKFIHNTVKDTVSPIQDHLASQVNPGLATFMILYFRVEFQECVLFENNTGTSLYVVSGVVSFSSIEAKFISNRGVKGGAVFLYFSKIEVFNDSKILFSGNHADSKGGAIYAFNPGEHMVHHHSLRTCFIDIHEGKKENVSFTFTNNTVGGEFSLQKNSIYAYPLWPCVCNEYYSTKQQFLSPEEVFSCIGEVNSDSDNTTVQITGPGETFEVLKRLPLRVYSGLEFALPVDLKDIFNRSVKFSLKLWLLDSNMRIYNSSYQRTFSKVVKLNGPSGSNGELVVRTSKVHNVDLRINVTFGYCPPGLAQKSYAGSCKCICSDLKNSAYKGTVCVGSRSSIHRAYWIGYISPHNTSIHSPENLYSAQCPHYFCFPNKSDLRTYYELPRTSSSEALDEFVCGKERTGILCGECRENYSVHFHSPYYDCKGNVSCNYGWLLYVVSELLPLTVAYVIIIVFNVKLTSGALNGFIFFAQIIDVVGTSFVETSGIYKSTALHCLTRIYEIVYRFFNLAFFEVNSLSFCLWKDATALDIIAIKYLTVVFAFTLVMITVLVMKYCTRCCKFIRKSYVVHGLSAFLIICYVQCTNTSFQLLIPTSLDGQCFERSNYRGVFYNGNVGYFSKDHLVYALFSLACIMTIVIIPPILLLWYPTGRMLLDRCGLSDSRIINNLFFLNRMKPLLDSFQSCYKDNRRFFSGLYFVYRFVILAAFAISRGLSHFYLIVEIQLLVMLAFHSIAQPYREWWHNVLDTLIFADLASINALSMFLHNYLRNYVHISNKKYVLFARALQIVLTYLPLIYLLVYIATYSVKRLKQRFSRVKNNNTDHNDNEFPARLIYGSDESLSESENEVGSGNYNAFRDDAYKLNKI